MRDYYFTYGSDEQFPYYGGWTKICGMNSITDAVSVFRIYHPDVNANTVNCAGIYGAEQFMSTSMSKNGNLGKYCWEVIEITRHIKEDQ